jgi:hypothetical protein
MKKTNIVNLTPHPLVFADGRTVESSGIARCEATETEVGAMDGIPIVITAFGAVTGLPPRSFHCEDCGYIAPRESFRAGSEDTCPNCGSGEVEHAVFVVSSITAQAVRDAANGPQGEIGENVRHDVFVPARPVRDDKGRIVACGALGRIR